MMPVFKNLIFYKLAFEKSMMKLDLKFDIKSVRVYYWLANSFWSREKYSLPMIDNWINIKNCFL